MRSLREIILESLNMGQVEKLLKKLPGVDVHVAGTGTIYLSYKGKKMRISDHERNYSMDKQRGTPDKSIYTQDVSGKELIDKYGVVNDVADFYGIEIPKSMQGAMTRARNKDIKRSDELYKIKQQNDVSMANVSDKKNQKISDIKKAVKGREDELKQLLIDTEKYADENPNKRSKRRSTYLKTHFLDMFGVADVNRDLLKDANIL